MCLAHLFTTAMTVWRKCQWSKMQLCFQSLERPRERKHWPVETHDCRKPKPNELLPTPTLATSAPQDTKETYAPAYVCRSSHLSQKTVVKERLGAKQKAGTHLNSPHLTHHGDVTLVVLLTLRHKAEA